MAGIINKPLALFRRPESPRPLHTRWGDVGISVPTEGSWNQYDNPHRPTEEGQVYGPGFVPDGESFDRTAHVKRTNNKDTCETEQEEYAKDNEKDKSSSTNTTSISRRNSLSLGSLRPGRLSVRLASRPKHLRGENRSERETQKRDSQRSDFAYKPIQQNYTAEITEAPKRSESPFKYIPTNGRYLEDIPDSSPAPRRQSAMSHRSSQSGRDSLTDSLEERDRVFARRGSHQEDDRQSLRSIMSEASDGSSSRRNYGLPPRRRTSPFVPADRRRASLLKPMTMTMVPDPEDLYE